MWHTLTIDQIRRELRTNIERGLSQNEVIKRIKKNGKNELLEKKQTPLIKKFLNQFKDFMIIVLIIAAIISASLSYIEGTNEYIDSIIIIAIVILNALMGVVQENKAEKALEALKKMSAPTCKVKRDGTKKQIESWNLVPGDIVYLETGCYVPADIRLIKTSNLKIDESALTGETVAIEKREEICLKSNVPVGDMVNMAFSTTVIVGRAWRRYCCRNWYEYKSWKNSKFNNGK